MSVGAFFAFVRWVAVVALAAWAAVAIHRFYGARSSPKRRGDRKAFGAREAGEIGELRVLQALDELPSSYRVDHNLCVNADGRSSQIDIMVTGPCGLVLLEVKYWSGHLDPRGEYWLQTLPQGEVRTHDSPEDQVRYHEMVVKQVLAHCNVNVPIHSALVLSHTSCTIDAAEVTVPLLTPQTVVAWIRSRPPFLPGVPSDVLPCLIKGYGARRRTVPWG